MTNLFELRKVVHRLEKPQFTQNKFVISTGAKRGGEICGFFFVLTQTHQPVPFRRKSFSVAGEARSL
jgi:hypothetical protein